MKPYFKFLGLILLSLWFIFALLICLLRFYLLPWMAEEETQFSQFLSAQLKTEILIEEAEPFWNGWEPGIRFQNVSVMHPKKKNEKVLVLDEALAVFSWQSLWRVFKHDLPSFSMLQIHNLKIQTEKNEQGFWLAGFLFSQENKNSNFLDWFFAQPHFRFKNIRIDHIENNQKQSFKNINFSMDNEYNAHRLQLTVQPPHAQILDFRAELKGDWKGDAWNVYSEEEQSSFYVHFKQAEILPFLKLLHLSDQIKFEIPQGVLDFKLWGNFSSLYRGQFAANFNFQKGFFEKKSFQVQSQLSGMWGKNEGLWNGHILFKNFALQIEKNAPLYLDHWQWNYQNEQNHFYAQQLVVEKLFKSAQSFSFFQQLPPQLQKLNPSGVLEETHFLWSEDENQVLQFALKSRLKDLCIPSIKEGPGVCHLSGNVTLTPHSAAFWADSQNVVLSLPSLFEHADIPLDVLQGHMNWMQQGDVSTVRVEKMAFSNEDATDAQLEGTYIWPGKGLGSIDLIGSIAHAKGNRVWRYLPKVIEKEVRVWLKNALLSGEGYDGKLILKGNLAQFPFRNPSQGAFSITAKSKNAVLKYAPNWPALEKVDADLSFGLGMRIKSSRAEVLSTSIEEGEVVLPDFTVPDEHLLVQGRATGLTQNFLNFIQESEIREKIDSFTSSMQAQGKGTLQLNLDLPIRRMQQAKVQGKFVFQDNVLRILPQLAPIREASGEVQFSESSVFSPKLTGKWLGGEVKGNFQNQQSNLKIQLESQTPVAELLKAQSLPLHDFLSGSIAWTAQILTDAKTFSLELKSDLKNLTSLFPAPLNKKAIERWDFSLSANNEKAQFVLKNATPLFNGAWVFGKNPQAALHLAFPLQVEDWQKVQRQVEWKNSHSSTVIPLFFSTPDVFWNGLTLGALSLHAQQAKNGWQLTAESPFLAGEVLWQPQHIQANLKRLNIPQTKQNFASSSLEGLPDLDLKTEELIWNGQSWGALELKAHNEGDDLWRLKHFQLQDQNMVLKGDGAWLNRKEAMTHLRVDLTVQNAGILLNRLGYGDPLDKGQAQFFGTFNWQNSPVHLDWPSLSGNIVLNVENGSFKKIAPGAGRLLGLLSLQSVVERLRFNFADLISEGLVFRQLYGELYLEKGMMKTKTPLVVDAPSATIQFNGNTHLVDETLNVDIDIRPELGFVTAVGLAFINPFAGAASALASTMGKNPLDKIFYYHYRVGGTWQNPQILKDTQKPAESILPYNPLKN